MTDETNGNEAAPSDARRVTSPVNDMQRLMATGARLLREKVDEHIAATSAYQRTRTELTDHYRVQMERLRMEADDRLRQLDAEHASNIRSLEDLIDKLKILRG